MTTQHFKKLFDSFPKTIERDGKTFYFSLRAIVGGAGDGWIASYETTVTLSRTDGFNWCFNGNGSMFAFGKTPTEALERLRKMVSLPS